MKAGLLFIGIFICAAAFAQFSQEQISSDFVRYQRRANFDRYLREQTVNATFGQPLDSNTEENYKEACWAISQFLLRSPQIEKGFRTLFDHYTTIEDATKRALLEAVYGTCHTEFRNEIAGLIKTEKNPRLFSIEAMYLYRLDNSKTNQNTLRTLLAAGFPDYPQDVVLQQLDNYLLNHTMLTVHSIPDIASLFDYRKASGQKTIYSFQRWNRDYPGMVIIQNADGSFMRDSTGALLTFQQLARSASDLPYFITNGSTPQGIYSILGMDVSHNNLIGPTPNIQLIMPNEADSVFWHQPYDSTQSTLVNYLNLLPPSWRSYAPMTESFYAGKAGRTEIIAHGTAIDPEYYKGQPFYPLTPTMGCLCARETWNAFNGRIMQSEQLRLANAFVTTPGTTGYLMVINLDNQQKAVSKEELEQLVEKSRH